ASGADETRGEDGVGGVVGQVLAGQPVDGRVEVGAGVLAGAEVAPVPGWPALVVVGDGLALKRPGIAERLGQLDDWRALVKRGCEVHDADRAALERLHE